MTRHNQITLALDALEMGARVPAVAMLTGLPEETVCALEDARGGEYSSGAMTWDCRIPLPRAGHAEGLSL
jgi:hypothetical protein